MHYRLIITIEELNKEHITCRISHEQDILLRYYLEERRIEPQEQNETSLLIKKFKKQFQKVMHSALHGTVEPGHRISCVFIDDFPFLKEEDYGRFILMDRREDLKISVGDEALRKGDKLFADGSFMDEKGRAGYGGFIEDGQGRREDYFGSFDSGSSNLMELIGVSEGLERLKESRTIQINTDSRFVIRGLVQWVHFWRYNEWQTAYGRAVRYAEHWQKADALCEGKLIQFNWIKGHSGHEEQDYCHRLAQNAVLNQ
ncbi:MAG: ribonuclease HI [Spirochaetales bacterium]|nr:ribonuclease HI [Spirochaetales bacterium]